MHRRARRDARFSDKIDTPLGPHSLPSIISSPLLSHVEDFPFRFEILHYLRSFHLPFHFPPRPPPLRPHLLLFSLSVASTNLIVALTI